VDRIDTCRVDLAALDLCAAVDLAIVIEEEARERYELLASQVGGRYPGDASEVFQAMADLQGMHRAHLARRRGQVFGDAPRRFDESVVCDLEAPAHGAVRVFMGPRDALAAAIEAEERAVDFYEEAAALVRDPAAQVFLEEQREEDADHCRALEAWMRSAPPGPDVEEDEADPPGSDAA
jgi:rubrerythrin